MRNTCEETGLARGQQQHAMRGKRAHLQRGGKFRRESTLGLKGHLAGVDFRRLQVQAARHRH
jgi:hypothetical protein